MSQREDLQRQLEQGLAALALKASAVQKQQLLDYLLLLEKWNQTYNLTAIRDPLAMISLHLLDSLALLSYVEASALLDVGSGAGLPSIPLAIMNPALQVKSVDSNGKKTRFQFQVKTALGLNNLQIEQARVEDWQPEQLSSQLVSRAFASLNDFVTWTEPLAASDARWLAMKGQYPEGEIQALPVGFYLAASHALDVPGIEGQRHLLIIQKEGCRT